MENITENFLRDQLLDRRQRLESVIAGSQEHAQLSQLLNEVDSALERITDGTYGICEVCHDPVEKERLIADPLVRYCLDHLTPEGRRALEQDLELASQMQSALLPRQDLHHDGWEINYHYAPHGPVSGDYCDLIFREEDSGNFFFALGDAAGKGVAASILMTHLHAIFRTLTASRLPVHQMVARASRIFRETTMSTHFATLVCGKATSFGHVEITNAGHCPPLLLHDRKVTKLEKSGLPVGLFWEGEYSPQNLTLGSGDCLLLYTDGLSETRSPGNEEYGEDRLARSLERFHALSPREIIHACLKDLSEFRSGAPILDDLTLMVIRRAS